MSDKEIEEYFKTANFVTLSLMYLNKYTAFHHLTEDDIKHTAFGHLGSSLSVNFILANLHYYLVNNNLRSQTVIGTGHSGVALLTNLWMDKMLEKYYPEYTPDEKGLSQLIKDFGVKIRAEINPEYPNTIYDGGELGYSLGVSYGYQLGSDVDIIPCIIGDGEAETGTLSSSWQLNRLLPNSKVLPIINMNEFKMGSRSYLSSLNDTDLKKYFEALGYHVMIVDSKDKSVEKTISEMQIALKSSADLKNPLIIFKSLKGFTLPDVDGIQFEGNVSVHKDPLANMEVEKKLKILYHFLSSYKTNIFNKNGSLPNWGKKPVLHSKNIEVKINENKYESLDSFLYSVLKNNKGIIFSPDEIYSNRFFKSSEFAIEVLNENLLQSLYQGYVQSGGLGFYVSYEGFMSIISSMITQYYKYLSQKSVLDFAIERHSLNYILTSTCWENTYSHQNPGFVSELYAKNSKYYNILYPKDYNNAIKCVQYFLQTKDKINILTVSKRHDTIYQNLNDANIEIEIFQNCENPDIILCATGDYMLDQVMQVYERLKNRYQAKIIYVTKPQILSREAGYLNDEKFEYYFNPFVPTIYLFHGYASVIKSLIYDRFVDWRVLGYDDALSVFGSLQNNLVNNGLDVNQVTTLCAEQMRLRRRLK